MKKVTKDNLEHQLKEATSILLEMARESSWNKISDRTNYLISEIKNDDINAFETRKKRKKYNEKKIPKSLKEISIELIKIFENLYDINLYIYKSKKESTIIEIQYYPKSSLEPDFRATVKSKEPMLHCKVAIPPYINDNRKIFDINWELGGIRYELNLFWSRLKYRWKYRN